MMVIDSRKIFENNYIYVDSRFGEIMEELRALNPCGEELPVSFLIRPANVPEWHWDVLLKRFCRLYALGDMESKDWDGSEDLGKMVEVCRGAIDEVNSMDKKPFESWLYNQSCVIL